MPLFDEATWMFIIIPLLIAVLKLLYPNLLEEKI
jgi:hypothetical protein